ncbi:TPA: hypothetical protein TU158_001844 [Streptococcus equi subsp. zooepidemicus]|nr:hypothetical protein [Streptococcus equi subsp. zooepidemicus]
MAHFDTTADVAKFIADFGFSINSTSASDFSSNHTAYHCTLTYDDKSIPVTYNGTSAPTVMDVVHAVVQDAYSYDTTRRSIDTFASEYGYNTVDTPISKVLNAFNECKESYEWLCDDYGKPLYSYDLPQLVKMIADHKNEITDKVNFIVKEKEASYAYSNPPVPEGFVSLKEVMNSFDLGERGDRITAHDGSEYVADTFSSIADDAVDIYHNKLFHWLPDNYGWLEDAADEGLLEGVKDGDIIKMIQIAQYVCYERDLYDHQDDILSYYVTSELHDGGLYMVDEDIAEQLSNIGRHFERLDSALDAAKDIIREALVASFEELYGEDLAEEMADKVIDENYTIVNPCVMNLSTVHEVNEKGYEQAFDNQWKDYLRQAHIDNLTAIFKQDGQALENFFNLNDWENLPTIDTFQEWYTNDFSQINEVSFTDDPDGLTNAQNEALARLDNSLFNPENIWSSTLSTHNTDKDTMTVSPDSSPDPNYRYQLLSRLQLDCEYYLGACVKNQVDMAAAQKHLWAGTIEGQIDKMRELYKSFPENEKPEWLSLSDINQYEKKMLSARDGNKNIRLSSISKDMSASSNEIKEHNTPDMSRTDHPER